MLAKALQEKRGNLGFVQAWLMAATRRKTLIGNKWKDPGGRLAREEDPNAQMENPNAELGRRGGPKCAAEELEETIAKS